MFKDFRDERNDFDITHVSKVEGSESWDVIYLSADTKYIAEVKVRDKKLKSWDHEGWILEEYKYNKLKWLQEKAKAKGNTTSIVYVNIFQDAVVIWNLDNIIPQFFNRDSKAMTTERQGRKIKSVAYLKSTEGTIYNSSSSPAKKMQDAKKIFYFLFPGNQ